MDNYIEQQIEGFVEKYQDAHNDYLKMCASPYLLDYYLSRGESDVIKTIKKRVELQNKLRKEFIKELTGLFKYANENNLTLIGIKGIFLEFDLYCYTTFGRLYDDIDLVICNEEREFWAEYFFKHSDFYIHSDKWFRLQKHLKFLRLNAKHIRNIDVDKINHIMLLRRSAELNIMIELHSNLNYLKKSNFNHSDIILNKEKMVIGNVTLDTLSPIDNLMFMCHHMIRHLPYIYKDSIDNLIISIDKIIDVALLLKKYKFDEELIIQKSKVYQITPYVALALYVTNEVFPNSVSETIIYDLIDDSINSDFDWKNIFIKLIDLRPIEIITGKIGRKLPGLINTVNFIEKHIGRFEEFTYFRGIKAYLWRKSVEKENLYGNK